MGGGLGKDWVFGGEGFGGCLVVSCFSIFWRWMGDGEGEANHVI